MIYFFIIILNINLSKDLYVLRFYYIIVWLFVRQSVLLIWWIFQGAVYC